jgi:uncharacterized protein (TIGR04222 family)
MNVVVLVFYAVLGSFILLVAVSTAKARAARTAGTPDGLVYDALEAAFLAGGPGRVADTVIASMHAQGRLTLAGPGIVRVHPGTVAHHPIEAVLLAVNAAAPNGALHWLRYGVMRSEPVQEIGHRLAERGLLVLPDRLRRPRSLTVTLLVLSLIGFPLAFVLTIVQYGDFLTSDVDPGLPIVLVVVPVLIAGIVTGAVCSAVSARRISGAGRRALQQYRLAGAHLIDPAHLVALNGIRAVPDQLLRAHLTTAARMRGASGPSYATSHDSDSDVLMPMMWCGSGGGSGCGSGGGSSCGGGGGSSCGGGGSSCGGGGGSSCGGSSSSSCGSSSS